MKPETLESLLIDRALGELAPEVDELLAAHLALDPVAARHARRLDATVRQAREAAAAPLTVPQRPLAVDRLQSELKAQRWRVLAGEGMRLAACLALGLVLGWMGHAGNRAAPVVMAPNSTSPALAGIALASPAAAAGGFWSLARLETAQLRRTPTAGSAAERYRLRWNSPVKMPLVEDNQ